MNENDVVNTCIEYLMYCGHFVWRYNNFPRYDKDQKLFFRLPKHTPKGVADIIGTLKDGRFIAVECKYKKGRQSEFQKEFQKNIELRKGIYILTNSLDGLIESLKKHHVQIGTLL